MGLSGPFVCGPARHSNFQFSTILGAGHIQENLRVVSSCGENGNACQHTPEHVNIVYERGGPTQDLHIQENPRVV